MKLIGNYTCPWVRKISVIMLEKGLIFEFVNASPWRSESHVPAYNPLGQIPVLVDDSGEAWYPSSPTDWTRRMRPLHSCPKRECRP